jgi:hypothetical protein
MNNRVFWHATPCSAEKARHITSFRGKNVHEAELYVCLPLYHAGFMRGVSFRPEDGGNMLATQRRRLLFVFYYCIEYER